MWVLSVYLSEHVTNRDLHKQRATEVLNLLPFYRLFLRSEVGARLATRCRGGFWQPGQK
jgi:hypothetical protein